ncbi:MAG: hypothetical protein WC799_20755 [Desulfobacteraceae bacterium]|jgi:hypothetical protein
MMESKESFYEDHLENLSSLYGQIVWLREKDIIPWPDLARKDKMIDAHIDGLVVGGDRALSFCENCAYDEDIGKCYGVARLLVRQGKYNAFKRLSNRLDFMDEKFLDCVARALCHEPPSHEMENFLQFLFALRGAHKRIAARVAGFHRFDVADHLYAELKDISNGKKVLLDVIRALGKIRPSYGSDRFSGFLHSSDKDLKNAVLETLVKIGNPLAIRLSMDVVPPSSWPGTVLGLCPDKTVINDIFQGYRNGDHAVTSDHILAVGLAGDATVVPDLLSLLEIRELAESTALSMNLITGADLKEEIFIEDEIDEDSLMDDEKKALADGTLFPDGQRPGENVVRLSQNPDHWISWWNKEQGAFKDDLRYRNGKPISPSCLLESLSSEKTPTFIRVFTVTELSVRYGISVPFDPWMSVVAQSKAMRIFKQIIEKRASNFVEGVLYFNEMPVNEENSLVYRKK